MKKMNKLALASSDVITSSTLTSLFGGSITSGTRRKLGRPRKQNKEKLQELQSTGISTEIEVSPSQQARTETPRRRVALKGVQREINKQTGEVDFLVGSEFGVTRVPGHLFIN